MYNKLVTVSTLALGFMVGSVTLAPTTSYAQTAPTTPAPCGQAVQPTCGIYNPYKGLQFQDKNVTASVTVNGGRVAVTYTPPPAGDIPLPPEVTASAISTISSAIGNNVSAKVEDNRQLQGNVLQDLFGSVAALNVITTQSAVPGLVASITSAFGNTSQAEACCGGMNVDMTQTVTAGSVLADARVTTAPGLGTLSMATTASANAIGTSVTNGPLTLRGFQLNNGGVFSSSQGAVCCNNGSITVASTAVANSSASASTNSTVYSTTNQRNNAQVLSGASHVTGSGTVITSATQATGNSVYATNKWGYTQVDAQQVNTGRIGAVANLTAHNYLTSAVVGATTTGNSILLSSQGADGTLIGYQTNGLGADITTQVYLDGSSSNGGVAQASGTAIANSMTGYACSGCGTNEVKMEGIYSQTNSANVTSSVNIGSNMAVATHGSILGQSTAVGNSATFIAQRNN